MKRFFSFLKEKFHNKLIRRAAIFLGLFAVTVLIECTAFNYRAFPGRGEVSAYDADSTSLVATEVTKTTEVTEDGKQVWKTKSRTWPTFTLNFDEPKTVNTVFLDLFFEDDRVYRYEADVRGSYIENGKTITVTSSMTMEVVRGAEYTKYFMPDFNHAMDKITIALKSVGNFSYIVGTKMDFGGIHINEKMPFNFSWVRVGFMMIAASSTMFFICLFRDRHIKDDEFARGEATPKKKIPWAEIIVYAIPLAAIILMYALHGNFAHNVFNPDYGSQISKELVDAFMHGHVYLDAVPSDELLALPNPYDTAARNGVSGVLWDHLLYNGRYYSYYGIAPVFMLFLPARLLTGQYLYDAYGVLIFSLVGTLFMSLSYERLLRLSFKDRPVPPVMKFLVYGILVVGCGVFFNLERPYFYEVATSSAFMCIMIGLYHVISCGLIKDAADKKYFYYHLVMGSVWGGLAVLCRPTMALYSVCHVILLVVFLVKRWKGEMKEWKPRILFLVASLSPYVVLGGVQCVYNYMRFGSILDFGIEYSLTIADFKNMPFHFGNVLTSIHNFMFGGFSVNPSNSFFIRGFNARFGGGYYFFETSSTIGLYVRCPILLAMFAIPFREKGDWKLRLERFFTRWIPCLIFPFVQVAITWQSGFATRYFLDFSWPMLFFALFYVLREYQKSSKEGELAWFLLLGGQLFYGAVTMFNMCMIYIPNLTHHYGADKHLYTRFYYFLNREIMFWR